MNFEPYNGTYHTPYEWKYLEGTYFTPQLHARILWQTGNGIYDTYIYDKVYWDKNIIFTLCF